MNTTMNKLALAIGALVMAGGAMAADDNANLAVSATVLTNCAIGPGTLAFPANLQLGVTKGLGTKAANPANADSDSGTSISVTCTNGSSAAITAGAGANTAGVVATTRALKSGSNYIDYELYTDTNRTTVLDGTNSISYTGTGLTEIDKTTIFGRILGADIATAKAGAYADTVAMTITYTP
ncbi:Csu type fimbrial protein [Polaromonas naphthalenivorans]|nr:spore coat U domain-containing protein [Polaromonas naphthalenivorans]